jgi:GR25 family glycosyltransferase involved in LPS biosynthesis
MENIAHAVYINLDRRTDRRTEIETGVTQIGLSAERFAAIERKPGMLGCGLSHLAVLQKAKQEGWENVLILEDDFSFLVDRHTFEQELRSVFDNKIPYDVIMLSYGSIRTTPFNPTLSRVLSAQTTSGYLVHSRFYDTLIRVWSHAATQMETTGDTHKYALDQAWKVLQPSADWFCFNRRIGQQRPGFSDIEGKHVNYGGA